MPTPGIRRYRALLRLFPRPFREDHGHRLERLYGDVRKGWEEERGEEPGVRFWMALTFDTARAATAEWLTLLGDTIRSATATTMGESMSAFWGDIRYGVRQLIRQPMYGTMIVVLMALAIAGNAAVFRVFNGLFLKPLPFDEPAQLVDLDETAPSWDLEFLSVAYRDFAAWRDENRTFQSMAAFGDGGGNLTGDQGATRITYLRTTHDLDDVLRIEPLLGRFFTADEDRPDGPRAVVLTEGFWQEEFGGDEAVLGRTLQVSGYSVEVVGVLPPAARFVGDYDMWMPLREDGSEWRGWGLSAMGRLRPDATIEQARDDLLAIHKARIDQFEVNEISAPVVNSLRDRYLGDYRLGAGFLLGAVGIVLLIACANIAGLMTVRALARGPEMGVRRAMGAGRGRIVRQLLTESVVLAVIGAAIGAGLGVWGSGFLVQPLADQFPSWVTFELDLRFLAFTALVTVGAALLFGLSPALQATGDAPLGALSSRTSTGRRKHAMSLLVTGEVALAMALLVVGGLSVLDVQRLGRADPGFDPEGLVSYSINLPSQRYTDAGSRLAFAEGYLEELSAVPGVAHAAVASSLPLGGHWGWFFVVEGAPPRAEEEANPVVLHRSVSPDYFDALGVQILAGQAFDRFDGREGTAPVVVVNETFVETHLSHLDDPVGARISQGTDQPEEGHDTEWWTVVGVSRDVKHYGVDQEMRPGVYQPLAQLPLSGFQVALATRGDLAPVMQRVRTLTAERDVELPVYNVQTMTETLDRALFTRRAISWLIAVFSTVALVMAIAGIYGVISYSVGQRRQEISIRMAMGAERTTVVREVLLQGMSLVGLGAVIGLIASLAGARVVSGILVGVSARDPIVYVVVTLLLLAVAGVANYLPARRAASLHPMRALRGE